MVVAVLTGAVVVLVVEVVPGLFVDVEEVLVLVVKVVDTEYDFSRYQEICSMLVRT